MKVDTMASRERIDSCEFKCKCKFANPSSISARGFIYSLPGYVIKRFLEEAAMETKGVYDRGQPLVQMGILIASTLALAIVPLIAHHAVKKTGRGELPFIRLTFRTAFLFGWAAAAGLALVLPYINEMLFETRDGSTALIIFVIQIFWLSLILPLTAMLQGAGKVKVPALLLIVGLVVKIIRESYSCPYI